MLGLKSFRTAAITLAGIELAHRIRKRQFSLPSRAGDRTDSLKGLWDLALSRSKASPGLKPVRLAQTANAPELKQGTRRLLSHGGVLDLRPRRNSRKVTAGRGLYLLIAPTGGRYWRYNYTFEGKRKTLALGVYPDVPAWLAKERHQEARSQLAQGMDPMISKREMRIFAGA